MRVPAFALEEVRADSERRSPPGKDSPGEEKSPPFQLMQHVFKSLFESP